MNTKLCISYFSYQSEYLNTYLISSPNLDQVRNRSLTLGKRCQLTWHGTNPPFDTLPLPVRMAFHFNYMLIDRLTCSEYISCQLAHRSPAARDSGVKSDAYSISVPNFTKFWRLVGMVETILVKCNQCVTCLSTLCVIHIHNVSSIFFSEYILQLAEEIHIGQ